MDMAEGRAQAEAWRYAHGFNEMRVLKLMIEIGVVDILDRTAGPMTLSELSSAAGCPAAALYRIMRFLSRRGIFKQHVIPLESTVAYAPTPVSRHLTTGRLGLYMLAQSGPDLDISAADLKAGRGSGTEPASTDDKLWSPEADEESLRGFTEMMDCHSRAMGLALVEQVPEKFGGIGSLVDVGGRMGTTVGLLVKAFPWIKGINFDLPDVVSRAPPVDGVVHIGGDMFKAVPKADAVFLMWVLHDWGDLACIDILKRCKEAVPKDTGKVIIVDAILDEDDEEERDEFSGARLQLDMTIMMATAQGKERTAKEWAKLIDAAGFRRHTVKHMKAIESVIEAFA